VQQGQQRPQSTACDHREHGNDEQYVSYSFVDGRVLHDKEGKRQDDGRAHDEAVSPLHYRQYNCPQARIPIDKP